MLKRKVIIKHVHKGIQGMDTLEHPEQVVGGHKNRNT